MYIYIYDHILYLFFIELEIAAASATSTDPTKISESEHMTKAVPTQRSNPINKTGIGLYYHVTVIHISC